jgi:hypothetical protein
MNGDWKPTAKLRWVNGPTGAVLQQWYAPDVPAYMIGNEGEWRVVPTEFADA